MSLTRTVALNTIVQLIGRVITTASSLVVVGALTRYLGVAGYGQYTTIFAYVAFLAVLADSGFFWIMLRELSRENVDASSIASNVLTLKFVLGLVFFALGSLVAFFIPQYAGVIRSGIAIVSFGWLWMSLNSTFVGVFQVRHRMDQAVITDIVGRLVTLTGVLWLIAHSGTLPQIMAAYVLGNIVNLAASLLLGRQFIRVRPQFDFVLWRKLFLKAWPMGIVIILGSIYFKIDTVMLSLMKSSVEVGIYGAPYKILEVLLTVPIMFLGNIFPTMTRYLEAKDDRLERIFQRALDTLLILALPIVIGTIILAKPILLFVAGGQYVTTSTILIFGQPATGVLALQILIVAVGIYFISNLFNYLLIADGRQRELIAPNILFVIVNVGANLIAIPKLSYIGTSLTTVLTEIVITIVLGWMVYRRLGLRPQVNQAGRILISTLGMGGVVWLLRDSPLLIAVAAGVVSYMALLVYTRVVTKDLLQSLRGARL